MDEVRLALVGFGNVAQGLTQILAEKGDFYARKHGLRFLIVAISDPVRGTILSAGGEGIDPASLLEAVHKSGTINDLPGQHPGWDALEMIHHSPADVVVELSYTNLATGEPATTYIAEAIKRKRHVVTTNKGPIALHYKYLAEQALIHEVQLGVEGTVMSGTPCLRMGREFILPAGINKIEGILNGTTNYILTQMESGRSYDEALAEAQALGYAEADPSGDVDGHDAAAKVAILAQILLDYPLALSSIQRTGISGLSQQDMAQARAENRHWKLIGSIEWKDGNLLASVQPQCLAVDHPLAVIGGVTNAIRFSTDLLGDVTIIGPGAGRMQTGYAIIQDLLAIFSHGKN